MDPWEEKLSAWAQLFCLLESSLIHYAEKTQSSAANGLTSSGFLDPTGNSRRLFLLTGK
jgi:hypothetical protein